MKLRKLTAVLLAGALLASVTGTALAAPGDTVPGVVYGVKPASDKVAEQAADEIRKNLEQLGGLTKAEIERQVALQLDAKVVEITKNKLAAVGIKDIAPDNWAAGSVAIMVEAGFMAPDTTGSIKPDAPASQQSAVSIFAKVLGIASKTDSPAVAAEKAKQAGLTTGSASASQDMSRMEVARLIATALGVKPTATTKPHFSDTAGLSQDDALLLGALYDLGVFKGFPDGTFQPNGVLTTAQIAVLIDRILGVV